MRVLRWLGDVLWVYLVPSIVVLNVVFGGTRPSFEIVVAAGAYILIGLGVTVIGLVLMISGRALLSLTERHSGTLDRGG